MLLLGLAAVVSELAVVPPSAQHPALMQQLRLQCRDAEAVLPTFGAALQAEKLKDEPTARKAWEAVIDNCGTSSASYPPRIFRAEMAWREKDYAGVLSWIGPVSRVGPLRVNLMSSMLAMEADQALGDHAAFVRERTAVEDATQRALTRQGQELDRFQVNGTSVVAYSVKLSQGGFLRLMAFTISPANANALPESVMLTDDQNARAIMKQMNKGGAASYFVDAYTCISHATVKMIPGHGDQPPTYEEVKPLVVDYLKTRTWMTSQTRPAEVACAWPQFVAPGVTN